MWLMGKLMDWWVVGWLVSGMGGWWVVDGGLLSESMDSRLIK